MSDRSPPGSSRIAKDDPTPGPAGRAGRSKTFSKKSLRLCGAARELRFLLRPAEDVRRITQESDPPARPPAEDRTLPAPRSGPVRPPPPLTARRKPCGVWYLLQGLGSRMMPLGPPVLTPCAGCVRVPCARGPQVP